MTENPPTPAALLALQSVIIAITNGEIEKAHITWNRRDDSDVDEVIDIRVRAKKKIKRQKA